MWKQICNHFCINCSTKKINISFHLGWPEKEKLQCPLYSQFFISLKNKRMKTQQKGKKCKKTHPPTNLRCWLFEKECCVLKKIQIVFFFRIGFSPPIYRISKKGSAKPLVWFFPTFPIFLNVEIAFYTRSFLKKCKSGAKNLF
jgi:hypothetical protein